MSSLDLKIPPPIVALLCAALAWAAARYAPEFAYPLPWRMPVMAALVLAGFALDFSGLVAFRKAKTTLNPLSPDRSTSIVQTFPYTFTRNPMYLGMALVLLGYCTYLANPASLVGVVTFCSYITRFQIIPEERSLFGKFGEPYARYKSNVRRWV